MKSIVRQIGVSALMVACGTSPHNTNTPTTGMSTRVAESVTALSNVDLRSLVSKSGELRFAAAIVGLRTIELVEEHGDTFTANALAAFEPPKPKQRHTPLFVWPIDADCDGLEDVAIGGLGEAYVVRALPSGGYDAQEPWGRYLPEGHGTGAFDQRLLFADSALIGECSTKSSLRLWVRTTTSACDWMTTNEIKTAETPYPGSFLLAWPDSEVPVPLLLQSWGETAEVLSLAKLDTANPSLESQGSVRAAPALPYLSAFQAIDAPVPLHAREGCLRRALGVGHAPGRASPSLTIRNELRRVQMFSISGDVYKWSDLPATSGVVAFGVIDGGPAAPTYVGVIRSVPGGHEFQLLEISDCQTVEARASISIDFDWRTPPAPLLGIMEAMTAGSESQPGFVPRYGYPMRLAVHSESTTAGLRLSFAHYDGYDARIVTATSQSGTWSLSFRRITLHETRDDLALPYTAADLAEERGMAGAGGP